MGSYGAIAEHYLKCRVEYIKRARVHIAWACIICCIASVMFGIKIVSEISANGISWYSDELKTSVGFLLMLTVSSMLVFIVQIIGIAKWYKIKREYELSFKDESYR